MVMHPVSFPLVRPISCSFQQSQLMFEVTQSSFLGAIQGGLIFEVVVHTEALMYIIYFLNLFVCSQ